MEALTPLTLLWCASALAVAGVVKGVTGIGIPLVSISLLTIVLSVPQAVVLLPVPIVLSNIWQSLAGGQFAATVRRFWPLLLALFVGLTVGAGLLASASQSGLLLVIGLALLLFAATALLDVRIHVAPRFETFAGVVAGALGGVLGGMSAVIGPPIIMLMVALGLGKDAFVGTIASIYLLGGLAMSLALAGHGALGAREMLWSALAALPLFAGLLLGQWLRTRVSETLFRKVLLGLLLVMGANLIRRAVMQTI